MDEEAQKFKAELAACRARQEERKMRMTAAPSGDDGSLPAGSSLRVLSTPPVRSPCPWPPAQPQTVGRGARPQSARFVQETLSKLSDDNARCKLSGVPGASSVASSRQLSVAELPPPAPILGVEQPQRALFTVELERWRDAFQEEARECIEELRGVMREAGITQFTVQLAEIRAADKAENAQLREHLDELLRVNSSLRQVELDHLKGGPASMELCRQHFAEEQERWREDDQRWAEQKQQLDLVVDSWKERCDSEEQRSRSLVQQLDQLQTQLVQLEEASRLQSEKVADIHQRTVEQVAAAERRAEATEKAMAALASERAAESRWREDREERLHNRQEDEERWNGMQAQLSQLLNRADEAQVGNSAASQELLRHLELKLSQMLEDVRGTMEEVVRQQLSERCPIQQPQAKGVLDTVRDALREALRDVGGSAETRWQKIGALMENLDAQLRLNHQGIEHWRQESQRWQVDADKANQEAELSRGVAQAATDEASRLGRELRDLEARGKKLHGQQLALHPSQQGCAAERGHPKSPKHAKAKRHVKEPEMASPPQDVIDRCGNVLAAPVFGTTAKRETLL